MSDSKVRPDVQALVKRGGITLAEWTSFRGNSWEWEALLPALNDEALTHAARHMLDNCQVPPIRPARTYNDAVVLVLVPELLRRLANR